MKYHTTCAGRDLYKMSILGNVRQLGILMCPNAYIDTLVWMRLTIVAPSPPLVAKTGTKSVYIDVKI